jgi:glucosyl-3-phosphoglycerate synthase
MGEDGGTMSVTPTDQPRGRPGPAAGRPRTFDHRAFRAEALVAAKAGRPVTVCIPARDEEGTVGPIVETVLRSHGPGATGLVDEVLVVDDGSGDATAEVARAAGARVVGLTGSGGKGGAMAAGLAAAQGDLLLFLDGDVENFTEAFVRGPLGPLLLFDDVTLVKAFYERPLADDPHGGGRVTELVARPVIELLFPELAGVRQPLAGETAAHRWVLEKVAFEPDYGVELGLLVDVARRFGASTIAQVDVGVRRHRNRPLAELRPQAAQVLRAALARSGRVPATGA